MNPSHSGILYLVPVLLGDTSVADVLPGKTISIASRLSCFIAENAKSARHFLKQLPLTRPLGEITVLEMDKHARQTDVDFYFKLLLSGIDTGLISEAGMPGIADPGSDFVMHAHRMGVRVVPLTGPSSLLLALSASGLNGQGFTFSGYLPREKNELTAKIRQLEKEAQKTRQTQLFIETPYRSQSLFSSLLATCSPATRLCVAADLTLPSEYIRTLAVSRWKQETVDLTRRPAVFMIL